MPVLLEATGDATHFGWATVDSGAHRSIFPLAWADGLGIRKALRRERTDTRAADGRRFKTWSAPEPVIVQIALLNAGRKRLWGPRMSLSPSFAKTEQPILGMSDFFPYFTLVFEAGPHGTLRIERR